MDAGVGMIELAEAIGKLRRELRQAMAVGEGIRCGSSWAFQGSHQAALVGPTVEARRVLSNRSLRRVRSVSARWRHGPQESFASGPASAARAHGCPVAARRPSGR